ncbi:MAG: GspE/PulE family protein [Candidatus Saccharibacteria bacterium]
MDQTSPTQQAKEAQVQKQAAGAPNAAPATKDTNQTNSTDSVSLEPTDKKNLEAILKEDLVKKGLIKPESIKDIEHAITTYNINLIDYLISQNIVSKENIGQTVAEHYGCNYIDLEVNQPSKELIRVLPEEISIGNRIVVVDADEQSVLLTTDNPTTPGLLAKVQALFGGKHISLAYSLPEDLDSVLVYYRKPLETRFNKIIQEQAHIAPEIIDEIIKDAIILDVSDIHFEPQENVVVIRFRIDGVLHEAGQIPKQYYEKILNRLKVQSNMRIDEHGSSQDGAIRYIADEEPIDIRISIVPTLDGEKVALRLLAGYSRNLNFKNLGFNVVNLKTINDQIHRPFGMIVTTGPTGSGKTTTLYALLKQLNNPDINVTTIEDPVEYKIYGVNQIQVNTSTNLTFTEGLRTIVRQDPDIILVGEIRDKATAKLAVNAALTGHLLFSTFHANDASTAIPRFVDMGVEPFLLASTLNAIIAQRLVRLIHPQCRMKYTVSLEELKAHLPTAGNYFTEPKVTLYYGKGCEACNYTGFKGRSAIYEIITVTPNMKKLIMQNPSGEEIWQLARSEGVKSLFEDGLDKVKAGRTTLEELMRVAESK